jgi:16S rRNA (cytosine967-C5)-methyltransferase
VNARRIALEVLWRVERDRAWVRPALDAALRKAGLSRADRAFASELANGVLRWRLRLDHALAIHTRRGLASVEAGLLNILRLGAYQLLFTRVKPHAAVHETVALAREHGGEPAARFVNAVLRSLIRAGGPPPLPDRARDLVEHLSVRESFPRWLVQRFLEEMGEAEAEATLAAHNRPPPLTVRVNSRRATLDEVKARLTEEGARVTPTHFAPYGLRVEELGEVAASPSFQKGLFTVQDEASQLVANLAASLTGAFGPARTLDACAAPGGKATALAELCPQGTVDAVDLYPAKVAELEESARRLGLANLTSHLADTTGTLSFAPAEGYDVVLLDAPCTGLGVLRRHPEAKWRLRPEQVSELASLQARLLENLALHVRAGGFLVYSVCTQTREETEGVVRPFLASHPQFRLAPCPVAAYQPLFDDQGFFRVSPHRHQMDGFFAALLRKGIP